MRAPPHPRAPHLSVPESSWALPLQHANRATEREKVPRTVVPVRSAGAGMQYVVTKNSTLRTLYWNLLFLNALSGPENPHEYRYAIVVGFRHDAERRIEQHGQSEGRDCSLGWPLPLQQYAGPRLALPGRRGLSATLLRIAAGSRLSRRLLFGLRAACTVHARSIGGRRAGIRWRSIDERLPSPERAQWPPALDWPPSCFAVA